MAKHTTHAEIEPIIPNPSEWDEIERRILELFRTEIYLPLLKTIHEPARTLKNDKENPLYEALRAGRVTYSRGTFSGRFSAGVTKALKDLGATWDRKSETFKLPLKEMPTETKNVIAGTETKFRDQLSKIDATLSKVSPDELAGKLKLSDKFDTTLWKIDQEFKARVQGLTVAPKLTSAARKKIADDWQNNLELYIKDFTEKEIGELRSQVRETVFKGDRYGSLIETIKRSYGVSQNKAKFLARQETKLLVTTFQEARYQDAGINEYYWYHVAGSPAHPVRPRHKELGDAREKDGSKKIYRFDDPPNTAEPNQAPRRNNPGQDYNCRCYARPVVRFKR